MARRSSRYRAVALVVIIVPIFTLVVIFGVEWNYVERISREDAAAEVADRSPMENNRKRAIMSHRSPLDLDAQGRKAAEPSRDSSVNEELERAKDALSKLQRQAHGNMSTGVLDSLSQQSLNALLADKGKLYKLLKERKLHELRMEKSFREMWWYVRDRVEALDSGQKVAKETIGSVREQYDIMRWHFNNLRSVGGSESPTQLNWAYWQRNVSLEMTKLMEKRLNYLQNPRDCASAKKLVCEVAKTCGFGCQIHHVTYCFILAYATKRTLVLDASNWRYSSNGWEAVFQPISKTCTTASSHSPFSLQSEENTVLLLAVDGLHPRPPQLPMAVPNDLRDRIMSFHGTPFAWFVAQFMKYLMRPSPKLKEFLVEHRRTLGLNMTDGPIVGVHVRRTDKLPEAVYHKIEEYMPHVEDWYQWYELTHPSESPVQRRIYLATDEPTVLKNAKEKYPDYKIYLDDSISNMANKAITRYSVISLFGLLSEIAVLSECNYLVCTFSSQVCRTAFERMQTLHVDASSNYYSLDDIYYYGGQQAHDVMAFMENKAKNQVQFKVGDQLGIAGNEKNGFSVGEHRGTRARGNYPSYKVEDVVRTADFPTFDELE